MASRGLLACTVVSDPSGPVHGLQHIERLFATAVTDDDAVGAHTESVDDKFTDANGALAFHVCRTGLHAGHVRLAQAQFGRVFMPSVSASFLDQILALQGVAAETADGKQRTVHGHRRNRRSLSICGSQRRRKISHLETRKMSGVEMHFGSKSAW